jgi:hypothetical protein
MMVTMMIVMMIVTMIVLNFVLVGWKWLFQFVIALWTCVKCSVFSSIPIPAALIYFSFKLCVYCRDRSRPTVRICFVLLFFLIQGC